MLKIKTIGAWMAVSGLALAGCHDVRDRGLNASPTAACDLASVSGTAVTGKASFSLTGGRMVIEIDMQGLSPGRHGLHVHEFGDCGNNAVSSGGHFNPTGQKHGPGMLEDSHAGDLGNLVADATGTAHAVLETEHLTFAGKSSVLGLTLVVDADPDDYVTQPSGNSGIAVACGKIYQTGP